jgi:hypothetical protein
MDFSIIGVTLFSQDKRAVHDVMHGEINGKKSADSVATFITRAIPNSTSPVTIIFVGIFML